ncbi:AbiV family abortive infection protein [Puia sp. P3]|uniref:AbiV family abortive infection protein n=1 Tax=Puia sp. P3 TaxID=3423952 RepID=UPI003D678579
MAVLSLENTVRLHLDSILLFKNGSFPSSFQLSVLALEEFGKAKALNDFIWNATTHGNKRDYAFEMKYLERLYNHPLETVRGAGSRTVSFFSQVYSVFRNQNLGNKKTTRRLCRP